MKLSAHAVQVYIREIRRRPGYLYEPRHTGRLGRADLNTPTTSGMTPVVFSEARYDWCWVHRDDLTEVLVQTGPQRVTIFPERASS